MATEGEHGTVYTDPDRAAGVRVLSAAAVYPNASQKGIAAITGLNRKTVNTILNEYYPKHDSVRDATTQRDRVLQYAKDNPKAYRSEIAKETGVQIGYVGEILSETDHIASVSDKARHRVEVMELAKERPPLSVREIADRCGVGTDLVRDVMISMQYRPGEE